MQKDYSPILYIDRETGEKREEKVYGQSALKFLYGQDLWSKILGYPLLQLLSRFSLFSKIYGWWQNQSWTQKKIEPFITHFQVDPAEFEKTHFDSFNDFFIRKLKPNARPIAASDIIIPADGRYWFYQNIEEVDHFIVKGQKFTLTSLLNEETKGFQTMVMARLCPTDYHRFHFPCDCVPEKTRLINGPLYSVNPIAIRQNLQIFTENKRCVTPLNTPFGKVLYIEVGATCVGSINQTFTPNKTYKKGDEKGFFAFGGSALILLFERIQLDKDLSLCTKKGFEMRCLLGQSLVQ